MPSCYNRRKRKKETTPAYIDIILYIYLKKSQLLFPKRSAHHPIASHSSVGGCSIECYCVLYTRQQQQSNCLVCIGWSLRSIIPQHTQHTHKTLLFFLLFLLFRPQCSEFLAWERDYRAHVPGIPYIYNIRHPQHSEIPSKSISNFCVNIDMLFTIQAISYIIDQRDFQSNNLRSGYSRVVPIYNASVL